MDPTPLSRTTSCESTRSRNSHPLTAAPSTTLNNRKGRSSEPDTTSGDVGRASISMPPPASKSIVRQYSSHSRRASKASDSTPIAEAMQSHTAEDDALRNSSAIDDAETTPTLEGSQASGDGAHGMALPDAVLRGPPKIDNDLESNRMSFSSLYSIGSAILNGAHGRSGPSSVTGSELDERVEGPAKGTTTATSSVSVTTSSHHHGTGLGLSPSQYLTPKDQSTVMTHSKVPPSPNSHSAINQPRSHPPRRSRSRTGTQRRISGSTGASSSSPASRDLRDMDAKRAPLGIIGVCALDSKARSKPSRNILNRLIANGEFEVNIFGDKIILDEDVENWPVCDYLISFFSDGFPLDKAIAYARLRKPFCVNDLPMQRILWDRRICLKVLDKLNVPTPKRVEVNRDGGPTLPAYIAQRLLDRTGVKLEGPEDGTGGGVPPPKSVELIEDGDAINVDGAILRKPFVEKPVSGENHNINIYYPKSMGGGGRRLFRKVNNKSSEKDDTLLVPRSIQEPGSSYIYEQFLRVENAEDVKAYTVGPDFCHAETRKSPVVDGVVKRNPNGKEVRYVTSLSKEEAGMAARIAEGFAQRVCGFDLLRTGDKSYVIDVNGWSFVKDNNEYYDKCASILKQMFIKEKQRKEGRPTSYAESDEIGSDAGRSSKSRQSTSTAVSHRAQLKSIFKSPSMGKLGGHIPHHHHGQHHSHTWTHGAVSPDLSQHTTPLTSPPSLDHGFKPPASAPPTETSLLPPSAVGDDREDAKTSFSEPPEQAESDLPPPASKAQWKLKGMVSVIRHADRTPKQKFKFTFHTKPFVDLLKGHQEEVLLIGEAALNSVLDAVRKALDEGIEDREKLKVLRNTLLRKGGWPGTKVQIKPMFRKRRKDEMLPGMVEGAQELDKQDLTRVATSSSINNSPLQPGKPSDWNQQRSDSLSGMTLSRIAAAENNLILDKLQLIMKWGGEPTHAARYQAQDLGENLRNDLLLMNREALEDVSIFSSSERRVTTSAQIFASAFLQQKEIPEDLIEIRKDLLDDSNAAKDEMDKVKKKLKTLLREGDKPPPNFAWPKEMPDPFYVVRNVIDLMKFHRDVMRQNYKKLQTGAVTSLQSVVNPPATEAPGATGALAQSNVANAIQPRWCCGEGPELFKERWEKLFAEFCDSEKVDPSKISELYDTMKFDALHNRQFLEWVFTPESGPAVDNSSRDSLVERGPEPGLPRTNTFEKNGSDKDSQGDKAPEKVSLGQRMGFRRRSEAPTATLKNATIPEYAHESYFSLYRGVNNNSVSSRAKVDARLAKLRELYRLCKVLFDYIGPQEYGIADSEKLEIGLLTSLPLLKEIVKDLEEVQASEGAKSFFYFTKESHIYTLLNCILEGGIKTKIERNAIPELDYLSQICFELYESQNVTEEHEPESFNYSIRITISPGCHTFDPLDIQLDSKHAIGNAPRRSLTAHHDWKEVIETLRAKFHTVKLPKSFTAINLSEKIPDAFGLARPENEKESKGKERAKNEEQMSRDAPTMEE